MIVKAIKTEKVIPGKKLFDILDKNISNLEENSVVAITSKIISICEGRILPIKGSNKDKLIEQEADLFLPKQSNKYNLYLTIKNNLLAVSAGLDESNSNGYYVLWPENPQQAAKEIWQHLTKKFNIKNLGVIITDSKTTPLRWGVSGAAIGYFGFKPLNDLIGTPDIFGRELKMTKVGVVDGLAAAAVLEMGEGDNQTPIAVINDIPYVEFTDKEIEEELAIPIDDDVYSQILTSVDWRKGKK